MFSALPAHSATARTLRERRKFGRPAGGARGPRLRRQRHGREAAAAALARLRAHQALLHQHAQQRLPPVPGARRARACARPGPAHASGRAGAGAPGLSAPSSRQRSRVSTAAHTATHIAGVQGLQRPARGSLQAAHVGQPGAVAQQAVKHLPRCKSSMAVSSAGGRTVQARAVRRGGVQHPGRHVAAARAAQQRDRLGRAVVPAQRADRRQQQGRLRPQVALGLAARRAPRAVVAAAPARAPPCVARCS